MTLAETGSFIVVVGGAIGGVYAAVRAFRADKSSQKASADAAMVSNFQTLYDEQKAQLKEVKDEVARVKQDQSDERKQWAEERKRLQDTITRKDEIIDELRKGMNDLQKQIDTNVQNQNRVNKANNSTNGA